MAYIIDETYFQRELLVPNADELNSGSYKELMQFIDEKSRLYLKDVLGFELFKDLDADIVNGNLKDDAQDKWKNFVNGVEYTKDGNTYNWEGLKVTEGAFKKSILANYTFRYWLEFNQSRMSGVGEVVVMAKNAVNVNPTQRLVKIWNEFVNMNQGSDCKSSPKIYYKSGVKVTDYLGNNNNTNFVSVLQFLSDNDTDYDGATLKEYKKINQLGI